MALQLYGFTDTTQDLELMVRANSRQQAQVLFDSYISQLAIADLGSLSLDKRIPNGTLSTSGFSTTGSINGGNSVATPLDITGDLLLRGAADTYASTPDAADNQLSIIHFMANIQLDDYSAGEQAIISKGDDVGPTTEAWHFSVFQSSGTKLHLEVNGQGIIRVYTSISVLPGVDGEPIWVRVNYQSGNTNFWYSLDSPDTAYDAVTWTSIGPNLDDQHGIVNKTVDVQIGAIDGGSRLQGSIHRVLILETTATDSPIGQDMFPSADYVSGQTWVASTTETYTLNGEAAIGAP